MSFRTASLAAAATMAIATANADSPVNFAYRDAEGNVHEVHFDGKAWQKLQLNNGGMTAAPAARSDPSAFAVGAASGLSLASRRWLLPTDHRDFSYVGDHGTIHHIFHQGGKWRHETLNNTGVTSAPPAAGRIAATAFNGRQLTYTYRDKDGNLQHIASLEGLWNGCRLNNGGRTSAPLAAGDPAVVEGADRELDVVYRDAAGGVQHLRWAEDRWQAGRLNLGAATGAPAAAGEPALLLGRDLQLHCAYRDISGNLHHLHGAESKWSHEQLNNGGTTGAAPAASDPAGAGHQDGQLSYAYRDREGGLLRLFLKEARWHSEKLDSAPAAAGPWIRCASGPGGETVHVFFLDGKGDLQHLSGLAGRLD